MNDGIRLMLAVPSFSLRRYITVDPSITIRSLKQYLPNPGFDLLIDGMIMLEGMPLASYAVTSGTIIVALAKEALQAQEHWSQLMSDREAFQERMTTMENPKLKKEISRLKDLRVMRLEGRPNFATRVLPFYAQMGIQPRQRVKSICSQHPLEPSTKPLPVWWRVKG
jgi:hypothetical protein